MFLHKTFRTGLIFPSQSKLVQIVVCYVQNLQKHKYLSSISMFLHETFRTGLIFLSRSKWVQIVVCYMQNLWKCKYLSEWHCGSFLASLVWKELEKSKNSKNYGKLWGNPTKLPKLAILSQSNWLFWQNLPLWVIFSQFGVKGIQKLKKFVYVPSPPRNANFWDFGWNEMLWWQKMGKVVNCMKMAILNESEPHYREKPAKWPELVILSQSNPLFWLNLALWVIFIWYVTCLGFIEN